MKRGLGVQLAYPTYREGMGALIDGDIRPFSEGDLGWLGLSAEVPVMRDSA
jgi:hypothetical protein